ncbi:MAG: outer membrane protein assembly factor BamE [Steroidobacteraceae bacterium]
MSANLRAAILLGLLLGAGGMNAGCVYRPNIQQGNLLKVEDVDQVQVGMTRSQVRYLLGTPMLADPFDPQRWDYIYTLQRGREKTVDRSHFLVRFDGDKVSKVEKLDLPEEVRTGKQKKKKNKAAQDAGAEPVREPPSLPPVQPPSPDPSTPPGA